MRFEPPAHKKLTQELVIPIRWGDMDAMGHVNNTLYFRYLETVRIEWMQHIGAVPSPTGCGPVVVNTYCSFIRELTFPGDVLARHYVCNVGSSSFDTFVTLERTDQPGVVSAEGGAKIVWTDWSLKKSQPLPDWMRAHLA